MDKSSMFAELYGQLQELHGSKVIVGVQADTGENVHRQQVSSDKKMRQIAAVHEYGCDIDVTPQMRAWLHHNGIHLKADTTVIHIPERSYIRRGYEEGKVDFDQAMKELIGQLFAGKITVEQLLQTLGRQAVTDTVANMGVDTKAVSQYTMEHRKSSMSSTPLTDTGELMNHITAVIKKGHEA